MSGSLVVNTKDVSDKTIVCLLVFQESFISKVRVKRHKKSKKSDDNDASKSASLVQRHASVLGLCAFVNANPYTVPEDLPDVLMILSEHLHDPQPIPVRAPPTYSWGQFHE